MTCSTASEGKPGSQAAARLLILGAAALLLGLSACAGNAPPTPSAALSPPPVQAIPETAAPPISLAPPPPSLSPTDAAVELARLRKSFAREVPHGIPAGTASDASWITGARAAVAEAGQSIDRAQLLVVVDRNPRVQELRIIMAEPDQPWQVVGGSRVSTGQAGRRDYYITPVGVFLHTDAILDYRAQGTFNENHIRGLGLKGMRVWDFGWHWATKGWRSDKEGGDIRLLMHATDPEYLEQRIGRPASEGCVRVPAPVNRFMDRHGVLDLDYERAAVDDIRYRALLLPDRTPTPLAGEALVVIDSSGAS